VVDVNMVYGRVTKRHLDDLEEILADH